MAKISSTHRPTRLEAPGEAASKKLLRESNTSPSRIKPPPSKKPRPVTSQPLWPSLPHISTAGLSREKKEAAIITPAPNPISPSISRRLAPLKKKTTAAPSAVTP